MKAVDFFIDNLSFKQLNTMLSGYLRESLKDIDDSKIDDLVRNEQEKLSLEDVTNLTIGASLWAISNNIDLD